MVSKGCHPAPDASCGEIGGPETWPPNDRSHDEWLDLAMLVVLGPLAAMPQQGGPGGSHHARAGEARSAARSSPDPASPTA